MSAKVLGRITQPDRPRGPDVEHRITLPVAWLESGAKLEIELPRNLTCLACKGGGCDACERSGAVSMRGRNDPIELLELTLPAQPPQSEPAPASGRLLIIRLPDRGGAPPKDSELPRGHLLLAIAQGAEPSAGVKRVEPEPEPAPEPERQIAPSLHPRSRPPLFQGQGNVVLAALAVAAALAALITWLASR
jgi:hypothetical protein